jgi:ribosomal protein S18 acetylase RimI-like enzyme
MVARKKRAKRKGAPATPPDALRGAVDLRPASLQDFDFAFRVYSETMKEYSAAYIRWDDAKQKASLAHQWSLAEVSVITLEDVEVGWLALQETDGSILLGHFYVEPRFQNRGVGSMILSRLFATAAAKRKPVELSVLKNNPARRLYERQGFTIVAENAVKYHMRRPHEV